MIKETVVGNLQEATKILLQQSYDPDLGRIRSDYLYRGMPDAKFNLSTSLERNCKDLAFSLEAPMMRYFCKYAAKEEPSIIDNPWYLLIVGQHYGLPTRLLDWSHSPLIAMHFASAEEDISLTDKRDGVIWKIDEREFTSLLPEKYQNQLKSNLTDVFSVQTLNGVASTPEEYDNDMQGKAMAILEPPSSNQRIINQYSYFTIIPKGLGSMEEFLEKYTKKTEKIIINAEVKWELRDLLDQLNVSERIVYPGLEGLTKWIKRHYYVK